MKGAALAGVLTVALLVLAGWAGASRDRPEGPAQAYESVFGAAPAGAADAPAAAEALAAEVNRSERWRGRVIALAGSADASTRARAWTVLGRSNPTPESYDIARAAFLSDATRDEPELEGLLQALKHPTTPSPDDKQALLARLLPLLQGPAGTVVRAHALQRIAEFDARQAHFPALAAQALDDPSPLMRQAAIGSVMVTGTRDDAVKRRLLQRATDPRESPVIRGPALMALEHFDMQAAEYRQFAAAGDELRAMAR